MAVMKINGIRVYIAPFVWAVFAVFVVLFVWSFIASGGVTTYLVWGLPLCLLLLLLPLFSSYSMGSQYQKLLPEYEEKAEPVKFGSLTAEMQGKPVRVEGVVQSVSGLFFGRPKLTVFDGTGSCVVFRSVPPDEKFSAGDSIEAIGMVVRKFAVAGDVTIHGVSIKKTAEGACCTAPDDSWKD